MRDFIQKLLLGKTGEHGTGTIPKDAIVDVITARGIADFVDIIRLAHASGGVSTLTLKSYSAGREKFQGSTLDYVALDEEAPIEIYTECLTQTNVTKGLVWSTFTPLQGVSEVVRRSLYEKSDDRELVTMTLDDCDHYDEKQKEQIAESYGEHEREARTKGIPTMGSGRIFPIAQDRIACDHRDIPAHWPRIGGMDFGWTYNFAACELAWDLLSSEGEHADHARGYSQGLGCPSLGVASGWQTTDARRRRRSADGAISRSGFGHALGTRAVRG